MSEQMALAKIMSPSAPVRMRLPDERKAISHKFVIVGGDKRLELGADGQVHTRVVDVNVYFTVGFYPDGKLGEIFIKIGKEGDEKSGIYDAFAIAISLALQYGIPIDVFIDKFEHTRFEPAGPTKNPDIPLAKSILDYIFRWLERFSEEARTSVIPEDAGNGVSGSDKQVEGSTPT